MTPHSQKILSALEPIPESPIKKPSIFGNFQTILFSKTQKDTKQIFMSA